MAVKVIWESKPVVFRWVFIRFKLHSSFPSLWYRPPAASPTLDSYFLPCYFPVYIYFQIYLYIYCWGLYENGAIQKIDNEEKSIKFREKLLGAFQRLNQYLRINFSKRETGGKIGEKISDITDNRSFIAGNGRAPESYQRSAFMGDRNCNCTIHDSAFQDRSFKSE